MASGKTGITVRFENQEMQVLDGLAERYRVTSATIIRWALRGLADHVERNGGRLMLPLQLGKDADVQTVRQGTEKATQARPSKTKAAKKPKKREA